MGDTVFNKMKAYDWETPGQLRSLLTNLKKLFKHLEIDKSTAESLIRMLKIDPAERGNFDNMMVSQLGETIDKRIASCEKELASLDSVEKYAVLKAAAES